MTKTAQTKKVLITGATGFIGSYLTQRLVEKRLEVGIIKRDSSDTWRIKDVLKSVKIYNTDLQDTFGVLKAISDFKPDIVFHLAAYYAVEHKAAEIANMVNINMAGTINLLEAVRKSKVRMFVATSSCFVYKASKHKLREDSKLSPLNLYALTKILTEQACSFYSEKYGLRCVTFRIFPPYGPGDYKRRLIPHTVESFLKKERPKVTSGKQKWDFIYLDDIADAYLSLLNTSVFSSKHEIFNIGTGDTVSIREVVLRLKEIMNSDLGPVWSALPHRKNELWFVCADISKAKRLLGWAPKTKILEKGLELTAKWFKIFWKNGGKNGKEQY